MFWCSAGLFDTANEKIKSSAIEPYWIDLILTLRCTHNPCRPWSFAVYLRTPGHPDRLDFSVLPFWRALICRQRRQRRHCPLRQRRRRRCRRRPWWTCMLVFLWYLCLCQTEILPVGVIRWLDDSILHLHIKYIYIYIQKYYTLGSVTVPPLWIFSGEEDNLASENRVDSALKCETHVVFLSKPIHIQPHPCMSWWVISCNTMQNPSSIQPNFIWRCQHSWTRSWQSWNLSHRYLGPWGHRGAAHHPCFFFFCWETWW